MSKANGFLQLRRGIWEHVRDGSLSQTGALAFIYMLTQADTRTGTWKGSAQCLATALRLPKSTAKYVLKSLDGRYIRRFTVPGRHACYPILLHRYCPSQGQHVGLMLDALSSKSERDLQFFKSDEFPASCPQVVQHVGPQRIRDKKEERKTPAAKPAPPADPRFQPFLDFAFRAFEQKHGQKPTWGGKDFKALSAMLASNKALTPDELEKRFRAYLASTEPFTQKQGGSLAHFCTHVDSFLNGPITAIQPKGGRPNGQPTATDLAIRNAQALGLDRLAN